MLPFPVGMMKSGGAFSPITVGATAWFDANGGTYMTGGGTVTQWTDRTGNGRHLTPSGTSMTSPSYASNKISCALASWQGFDTWAVALPATTWDVAFVGAPNANTAYRVFLVNSSGSNPFVAIEVSGSNYGSYIAGMRSAGTLAWAPAAIKQSYVSLTATNACSMGINGSTPLDAVALGGQTYSLVAIPFLGGGAASGQGWGDMYEVVFLPAGSSTGVRQQVEGYLAWKWDGILGGSTLVTALPGGHPYKSAAP